MAVPELLGINIFKENYTTLDIPEFLISCYLSSAIGIETSICYKKKRILGKVVRSHSSKIALLGYSYPKGFMSQGAMVFAGNYKLK
jgi:hypothetical protein